MTTSASNRPPEQARFGRVADDPGLCSGHVNATALPFTWPDGSGAPSVNPWRQGGSNRSVKSPADSGPESGNPCEDALIRRGFGLIDALPREWSVDLQVGRLQGT